LNRFCFTIKTKYLNYYQHQRLSCFLAIFISYFTIKSIATRPSLLQMGHVNCEGDSNNLIIIKDISVGILVSLIGLMASNLLQLLRRYLKKRNSNSIKNIKFELQEGPMTGVKRPRHFSPPISQRSQNQRRVKVKRISSSRSRV